MRGNQLFRRECEKTFMVIADQRVGQLEPGQSCIVGNGRLPVAALLLQTYYPLSGRHIGRMRLRRPSPTMRSRCESA
jgi:hypothetical protein